MKRYCMNDRTRRARAILLFAASLPLPACAGTSMIPSDRPYVMVLGTAQDGGIPQAGAYAHPGWNHEESRRLASCLGLVDPQSDRCWMFDATPDFRRQLFLLQCHGANGGVEARESWRELAGVFLTHAHVGHYTGLMFLGHESMGARGVPVYAMPKMQAFLEGNGPWDQLVRYGNISIKPLRADDAVALANDLHVTPFAVPHRQEYSEVVGYRIDGPNRAVLFIPDIDSWEDLDATGVAIEDLIRGVDVAYLDGTFFANGEIPGRDMSGFPHPLISNSIERFSSLPLSEQKKIRFIHLNHTNPAQYAGSDADRRIRRARMLVARDREVMPL